MIESLNNIKLYISRLPSKTFNQLKNIDKRTLLIAIGALSSIIVLYYGYKYCVNYFANRKVENKTRSPSKSAEVIKPILAPENQETEPVPRCQPETQPNIPLLKESTIEDEPLINTTNIETDSQKDEAQPLEEEFIENPQNPQPLEEETRPPKQEDSKHTEKWKYKWKGFGFIFSVLTLGYAGWREIK